MLVDGPGFFPQQQHKYNRRVCVNIYIKQLNRLTVDG